LNVAGVVAVSPTIDLDLCVRAIDQHRNVVYHWNFVRNLKARLRRKAAAWPGTFNLDRLSRIWTIRTFDDVYTAPLNGFKGAEDYYYRASALRVAAQVKIPLLILTAADDPFVPASQFDDPAVRNNPNITVRVERHGGHCGFVGQSAEGRDLYWAETTAIEFLAGALS
jgi:predicted alpha/beta-fold hydrolase